jgi:hypothetical protein
MLVQDKSTKAGAIKELQEKGVVFSACENTIRVHEIAAIIRCYDGARGYRLDYLEAGWGYIRFLNFTHLNQKSIWKSTGTFSSPRSWITAGICGMRY